MKNLDTLINELCPDGVEFVKLSQHCEIYDGTHQTPKYQESGIPFISVENIKSIYGSKKYISQEAYDAYKIKPQVGDVFMTRIGSIGACAVFTQKADIAYYVSLALLRPNSKVLNSGFLKYIIESSWGKKELRKRTLVNAVPIKVNKQDIGKIEIPLPPIEVQNEIVRILDKFTELEAELEAELDCRKRQYEFYRDKLLSFDNVGGQDVEWKKMSEVCEINRGKRVVKKELQESGDYPVFQNCLTPLGYYKDYNYPANTAFVISAGAAGNIGFCNKKFWAADDCLCLTCSDKIISKFVYYVLMTKQKYILSRVRKASIPRLSRTVIERLSVPIPSLAEQERIVSILDRFESLTTSLTAGLPAEIAARRQQYEHYRDKLLTFKRKSA